MLGVSACGKSAVHVNLHTALCTICEPLCLCLPRILGLVIVERLSRLALHAEAITVALQFRARKADAPGSWWR